MQNNLVYSSAEYVTFYDTAATHSGAGAVFSLVPISAYADATDRNPYPTFNWLHAFMHTKINDKGSFRSSLPFNYGRRSYAFRGSQVQFLSTLSQQPMYRPLLPDGTVYNAINAFRERVNVPDLPSARTPGYN